MCLYHLISVYYFFFSIVTFCLNGVFFRYCWGGGVCLCFKNYFPVCIPELIRLNFFSVLILDEFMVVWPLREQFTVNKQLSVYSNLMYTGASLLHKSLSE